MKRQRAKFPLDLYWQKKTYKLKRFIVFWSCRCVRRRICLISSWIIQQARTYYAYYAFINTPEADDCIETIVEEVNDAADGLRRVATVGNGTTV